MRQKCTFYSFLPNKIITEATCYTFLTFSSRFKIQSWQHRRLQPPTAFFDPPPVDSSLQKRTSHSQPDTRPAPLHPFPLPPPTRNPFWRPRASPSRDKQDAEEPTPNLSISNQQGRHGDGKLPRDALTRGPAGAGFFLGKKCLWGGFLGGLSRLGGLRWVLRSFGGSLGEY